MGVEGWEGRLHPPSRMQAHLLGFARHACPVESAYHAGPSPLNSGPWASPPTAAAWYCLKPQSHRAGALDAVSSSIGRATQGPTAVPDTCLCKRALDVFAAAHRLQAFS